MKTPSNQLSTEQIISAVSHLSLPELEQVFDHVLALQAERMAALVDLAKCRGVSLAVLMDQLGIHFPEHV